MSVTLLKYNSEIVKAILDALNFPTSQHISSGVDAFGAQLRQSLQNTALYSLPADQGLPPGVAIDNLHQYVHPHNIAACLLALCLSGPQFGTTVFPPAGDLQVYIPDAPTGANWYPLAALAVNVDLPIRTAPPVPAPPAPAPIIPPAPTALHAAVPHAAGGSVQAPATDAAGQPLTPAGALVGGPVNPPSQEDYLKAMADLGAGAPAAPAAAAAPAPEPKHVDTFVSDYRQCPALPAVDVTAPRTSAAGRPAKSALEKAYAKREKFGKAPYWWGDFRDVLPKILTEAPPQAVSAESTAPTAVMTYGLALHVLRTMLHNVDGAVTIDELRRWTVEVEARIMATPSSGVAFDLVDNLFKAGPADAE